jgi:hypothetical protein
MDKRSKMAAARDLQRRMLCRSEIPKTLRDRPNGYLVPAGCRYLRIRVEDVDTGETVLPPLYTVRRPNESTKLYTDLENVAIWPEGILSSLQPAIYVNGQVWLDGSKTARQVEKTQLSGGRKPGPSLKIAARNADIYKTYKIWNRHAREERRSVDLGLLGQKYGLKQKAIDKIIREGQKAEKDSREGKVRTQ